MIKLITAVNIFRGEELVNEFLKDNNLKMEIMKYTL